MADLKGNFLEKLRETGVEEKEIDLVVFSHLHCDHVGWNTKLVDGKWVATFANAKYLFVKEDYDYWKGKPEKEFEDDKLAFDDSVLPIVEAGLAEFVGADYQVDENFSLIPSPGHTPGHVSFMIESNGEKALISGDFIHHPCQFEYPEWTMDVDFSAEQLKILDELADTETLLIGSHFAGPVSGRVVKEGNSFILKT